MINKNNQKSKLQGVFKTVDILGRNSSSKVYYRVALREEADKFLNYLISEVEKGYRPLIKGSVSNSVNLKELFSKAKNSLMIKFLNNNRKIIAKWWKIILQSLFRNLLLVLCVFSKDTETSLGWRTVEVFTVWLTTLTSASRVIPKIFPLYFFA